MDDANAAIGRRDGGRLDSPRGGRVRAAMPSLPTLLLQIAVIIAAARLVGWSCARLGQPRVVGEIAAGILLGPSLLGWAAPELSVLLFPPQGLRALQLLSQAGLLLFMFQVGLEFDPALLRGRGRTALATSWASIALPFLFGAALAVPAYARLSEPGVSFTGFALFMGAAMSVTAFPVLARILTERGLMRTRLGAIALACAAVDDVSAWTILAVVVGIVRSAALQRPLWLTLVGFGAYAAVMLAAVRPLLARSIGARVRSRGAVARVDLLIMLVLLSVSAWTTAWLGVHALFGAFAIGAVMPKERDLTADLTKRLGALTLVVLLPLFFAYTGLRTRIGLVSGGEMWLWAGAILVTAVAGKLGGSLLAARATGLAWREATALGVLMNTRGLMELVILSVGLELGVVSPTLFTMMILMALITTAMTTPLLRWVYPDRLRAQDGEPVELPVSAA
jgi:Kef-type K+ transport system membrane component KefB